jgi:hypothetical protein
MTTRDELQRLMDEHDSKYGAPEKLSDKWRREATEAEAERKAERDSKLTEYEAARLRIDIEAKIADVQARIDQAVAAERAYWNEALPELLALMRREITAEISAAVGELRADVNVQRAVDQGVVTELPSFLRKAS